MDWKDPNNHDLKVDPMDEEIGYDKHEHQWEYIGVDVISEYPLAPEYAVVVFECKICGTLVSVPFDENWS